MAIAGELINILGFKLEGTDALRRFNTGMDDAEKKTRTTAEGMKKIGSAALGVGLAAAGFTAAAYRDAAQFERTMNRIGITAGSTKEELSAATDEVRRLATDAALPIEDAVAALDTLTSSGMNLKEAMSFLPSVLQAAQASGAATNDMANTALKAASALQLQASELDKAFDIMVTGGKAGQFELKDMATYIPELANSFASLGYKGQDGLKTLVALLQTVREDTGSASGAATQLGNVLGKIYAGETKNAFEKMGVDLDASLKKRIAAGQGAVEAFVEITKKTIGGDMSKLPLLFTDQEFRLGMQSLITSGESYAKFVEAVNSSEVDGSTLRDFNTVVGDSQASIQKMSNAWSDFMNTVGSTAAPTISSALDWMTDGQRRQNAIMSYREKQGEGWFSRNLTPEFMREMSVDEQARRGGYIPLGDKSAAEAAKRNPEAYNKFGSDFMRPFIPEGPRVGPTNTGGLTPEQQAKRDANMARGAGSGSMVAPPVMQELAAKLDSANAHLAQMTAQTPTTVDAVVTDARTDARQFPITTTVNVGGVNVAAPSAAPGALGAAVGNAAASAVNTQAARIESEPAL